MLMHVFVAVFLISGTFFMVVAGIGIVRMPDVFLRLSATTKAATLGIVCMLGAAALYFGNTAVALRTGAIVLFLVLTTPIAAHMIGRAALARFGDCLWEGTVLDEHNPR